MNALCTLIAKSDTETILQVLHYVCAVIHHHVVDHIVRSYVEDYSTSYGEIIGNISGALISRHEIMDHPRVLPPNAVYFLGSHLDSEKMRPLYPG